MISPTVRRFPYGSSAGQLANRLDAPQQSGRWPGSARDERSREDLGDMAEGPADLGRRLPVVERDWERRAARCRADHRSVTHFAIEGAVATGAVLASAPASGMASVLLANRVDEMFRTDGQRIRLTLGSSLQASFGDQHPEVGALPAVVPGAVDAQEKRF